MFVLFFGSGANSLVSRYDLKNLNLSYHMSLKLSLKPLHKHRRIDRFMAQLLLNEGEVHVGGYQVAGN